MRWNHLILALLGVCILSKGAYSQGNSDDDGNASNVYVGGFGDTNNDEDPTVTLPSDGDGDATPDYLDTKNDGEDETTPEPLDIDTETPAPPEPETTKEPEEPETTEAEVDEETTPDDSQPPNQGSVNVETTEEPDETTEEAQQPSQGIEETTEDVPEETDEPEETDAPEETTPEDSQGAVGPIETTEEPVETTEEPVETTEEPVETTEEPIETTEEDTQDPNQQPAVVEETTPENTVEETTEDVEETTEYVEETTEDSSGGDPTAAPPNPGSVVEETTEDPIGPQGGILGNGLETSTEAEATTEEDPQANGYRANGRGVPKGPWGNGKEYSTMSPDLLAALKTAGGHGIPPDQLPDGTALDKLPDEYAVYPGLDEWSKIVANKNGFFVLHPVQTNGQTAIFDPYTIGQVLGYIYEYEEFAGQRPKGGWTIELMGKKTPNPARRKRSAEGGVKSRRATLVFTKKAAAVAAKEERDYWKNVIASV